MDQSEPRKKLKGYFEFVRDLQKTLKSFRRKHIDNTIYGIKPIKPIKPIKQVKVMNPSKDDNIYYFGQRTSLKNLK